MSTGWPAPRALLRSTHELHVVGVEEASGLSSEMKMRLIYRVQERGSPSRDSLLVPRRAKVAHILSSSGEAR